ncbi:E3 ubiquitin-protein ligase TM129 [Galendromus occidentalis]|uniref:E3 ubiquitin-protein ligase TM129 n=1 Tax=Galendromus occidentalis TaxID=34638 RepID=A0AAJ6QXC7_9ACAR|nr:E3 ubiquitin-protein ligase TM129 [Galendromus occidentalis]
MIASDGVWFTITYALLTLCVMAPTGEIIDSGLTVSRMLKGFIVEEHTDFIAHHLSLTAANTIVHSILPLGYVFGLVIFGGASPETLIPFKGNLWPLLLVAVVLGGYALNKTSRHYLSKWSTHPVAKVLSLYTLESDDSWRRVAERLNAEFRGPDKFSTAGGITRTIVLPSWLIHLETYEMHLIHIADAKLKVIGSAEHLVSHLDASGLQCLTILVESRRERVPSFTLQLNSSDYDELRQRLPLENSKNIPIHRNLSDRFIEAFRANVRLNPTLEYDEELDSCIGCMQAQPDVVLRKLCDNDSEETIRSTRCVGCLCRPLWCSSCLARWFASRQDPDAPHTWLRGKCPCPTCRSTFCLLDVQPLILRKTPGTSASST